MKKTFLEKTEKWLMPVLFCIGAVSLCMFVVTWNPSWLSMAVWSCLGVLLMWRIREYRTKLRSLSDDCYYKDNIINGLYEQRSQLYLQVASLRGEVDTLKKQLTEKCSPYEGSVPMPADVPSVDSSPVPLEEQPIPTPTLLDKLQVRITPSRTNVTVAIDAGLHIRPKDEQDRWWKLRGYDTELPRQDSEYYIYIRLSHRGFDAEVRFLRKARLVRNDTHRFIQVGTISAVDADGSRTIDYSFSGFCFKCTAKKKAE